MSGIVKPSELTVLVVDDDPVNLEFLKRLIAKTGYRTEGVRDGPACIEAAIRLAPDLILLDVYMPGMDGLEICRILKEDERTREIPVIFVTASEDKGMVQRAFKAGGADYVQKPVNRIELQVRVESVLNRKRLLELALNEKKLQGSLEMAGAVCHELNQPLQVVLGYAQLIRKDLPRDELLDTLEKIQTQIERMGNITRKLMSITRYETFEYMGGRKIVDIHKSSNEKTRREA